MEIHEVESCVRGFDVYGDIWTPSTGERLTCERDIGNPNDTYAVAIKKGAEVVGHVPRKISAACALFSALSALSTSFFDSNEVPSEGLSCRLKNLNNAMRCAVRS